jgi:type III pantothenate kinase
MTPLKRTRRPSAHAPALLTVDLGNTETTLGVFQDEALVLSYRLLSHPRTPDETFLLLRQMLAPEAIDLAGLPSVLCSVVPNLTEDFARAVTRLTGRAPTIVGPDAVPDIVIRYADPAAVGPDRLANAIAVRALYGAPAIVVDVGTATTFDVVGKGGDYLGGAIAPGLALSAEALFARAARLGKVELVRPKRVIGRTTEESLQSGIVLGYAGLVDTLVTRILVELGGEATVVATGGLARLLEGEATTLEIFDEGLTLKGLRLIHEALAGGGRPGRRGAGGRRGGRGGR